jgi:hypothetical protein
MGLPIPYPSRTPQIQSFPPPDGIVVFEKVDFTLVFVCFWSFDEPVAPGILTFTQVFVCFLNLHKPVARGILTFSPQSPKMIQDEQ